jgi:hypothetical protein
MKHIYVRTFALACCLGLTFLTLTPLMAQGWTPFPSNRLLLYSFAQQGFPDEWYFAAHADSVVAEGADSAYYLYRIDRPVFPTDQATTCGGDSLHFFWGAVIQNQDHYLGKKMLQSPDGECRFISSSADTFLLRTRATVGNTWAWAPGVTATVDSVVLGIVLGASDSLKYVSLSSGQSIVLSKDHGMVHCFAFLPFMNRGGQMDSVAFDIWGIPAAGLGRQFPDYAAIFDWDVNDKFGIDAGYRYPNGEQQYLRQYLVQSLTPGTRFEYGTSMDYIDILRPFGFPPDSTYYPAAPTTVVVDSTYYPWLGLLPYQTHPLPPNAFNDYYQYGIRTMAGTNGRIRLDFAQQTFYDTCAHAFIPFEGMWTLSFATGLGEIHYSYMDVGYAESRDLYCYEKGSETWGACLALSTLIAVTPSVATRFQLSPNPATDVLRVELQDMDTRSGYDLTILDLQGHAVTRLSVPTGSPILDLDVQALPQGMYVLRIDAPGRASGHQKFVVVR